MWVVLNSRDGQAWERHEFDNVDDALDETQPYLLNGDMVRLEGE